MKRIHAVFALVLALTMIFTGCNGADNTQTNNQQQTTQQTTQQSQKDEAMTITWLAQTQPNEDDSWGELLMEETFGVNIEVVRVDQENRLQQINLLMAAGQCPDYLKLDNMTQVSQYANKNVLAKIPMSAVDESMPKYRKLVEGYDPNMFNYGKVNGDIYAVPHVQANGKYIWPVGLRADWLIKLGEDVPTTIDEYTKLFRRFRNDDPDGNGVKDTYALTSSITLGNAIDRFFPSIFGAYGTYPFFWLENSKGELQYGFTMDGTKEALKTLNQWYEEELLDPEFITTKFRTQQNDDVSYKFASGQVGYIDCYSYDDWPIDNDGQVSAKWVANNPEWQEHFDKNLDNAKEAYKYSNFRSLNEITDDVPSPAFLNPPLPKGPDGISGSTSWSTLRGLLVFGKQVENDPAKLSKLLEILETMVFDEELSANLYFGPKDVAWEYDDDGYIVNIAEFRNSDQWHPQGLINGTIWCFNSTLWTTPESLLYGGERLVQRYERSADIIALDGTEYDNKLLGSIPSANEYPDLQTNVFEYLVKCITGDVDIEETYNSKVEEWYKNGGQILTDEANDWYKSLN